MNDTAETETASPKRRKFETTESILALDPSQAIDDIDDIIGPSKVQAESPGQLKQARSPPLGKASSSQEQNLRLPGLGLLDDRPESGNGSEVLSFASTTSPEQAKSPRRGKAETKSEGLDADQTLQGTREAGVVMDAVPRSAAKDTLSVTTQETQASSAEELAANVVGSIVVDVGTNMPNAAPDRQLRNDSKEADPARGLPEGLRLHHGEDLRGAVLTGRSGEEDGVMYGNENGSEPDRCARESLAQPEPETESEHPAAVVPASFEEMADANKTNGDAEFELDSSPLGSSSSDTSDDSSSSDDSDADDYKLLSPEEQARRLMAEEGDSDDDGPGPGRSRKTGGQLRTMNEKPDEVVTKPDIVITADMKIEELGQVENVVENLVLIKAKTSGEYQVLESGSVLCLENKAVIGVVAETLGRVQQPYYSVRFTNAAAIAEADISKYKRIFYVGQHSTYVFTHSLKAFKGSDASNLHDEEVGDDEIEFSDDEAEAEHKRMVKVQRQAKRDARNGEGDGFPKPPKQRGRGGRRQRGLPHSFGNGLHSLPERPPDPTEAPLNYDDGDGMDVDEELYTPLVRPENLHEMMGPREAPVETQTPFRGGHRGGVRGRQNRGRGDRGPRGGHQQPRGTDRESSGARGGQSTYHSNPQPTRFQPLSRAQANSFPLPPPPPLPAQSAANTQSPSQAYPQLNNHQPQYPPSYAQLNQQAYPSYQQPYPYNFQTPLQNPPAFQPPAPTPTSPGTGIPPGAHINPAFFRQQQMHQQQQNGWGNGYGHHGSKG